MLCTNCGATIASGSRFCGFCGTPAAEAPAAPSTPSLQAKLTLIKGEGFDGISYQLNAEEHIIGRLYGTILFPEDVYLDHKHANLYYDSGRLMLKDEGSANGVFIKIKQPVELKHGDVFLSGEQLLRFEKVNDYQSINGLEMPNDETDFYGCPPEETLHFRIVHLFRDGKEGAVYYATSPAMNIGREQCELSFPFDRHISGRHARVYEEKGKFYLQDLGSKNGTFHGLTDPYPLNHGDYFFAGQQLMRIELTQS
ncbi:MAG: hypothetical protein CL920_38720 [Deltaproteobacteria bacterium]|nr:hypothetical protein [Deltaproteobacteria bacterium]|tara:strand:+ start:7845 stop:8606 length:762 start_codon:yes stop_codon:yes gene_type:complete